MLLEILLLLFTGLAYIYYKVTKKQATYWQSQGVKCPPATFPMGSAPEMCNDILFMRVSFNDVVKKQYNQMKGQKFYGTYKLAEPCVVITDPDLIKQILVKDFNHFVDRIGEGTMRITETGTRVDQIAMKQLVFSSGEAWKNTRATFSPIFTSGKMKAMVRFIHEVNEKLMAAFEEEAQKGTDFDVKEKFGKFSMDSIASCAFGMDAQSFTNSNSVFVKNAQGIFMRNKMDVLKILISFFPGGLRLLGLFNIPMSKTAEITFFDEVIQATLRERRKSNVRRNDLIDMMLDAMKEDGTQDADEEEMEDDGTKLHHKANKKEIDELTIVATALIMLVAGYDTTGQTLAYCAYELANNQDVQKRLQEEIDEAMEGSDGKTLDYSKIQSLEYLDMVFHETLRRYPPIGTLQRACTEDYIIPGTNNIKLYKGQELLINVAGLHSDPEYYPDPDRFNPEHFSKENKAKRHPYAYLGFGQGPRNCIGMRFAILEAKIALISMLHKYNVVKSKRTVEKITLDPASQLGGSKDLLYVKLVHRNK